MTEKKRKREEPSPADVKYAASLKRQAVRERLIDKLYTEGAWGGRVNYECKACPFSTLDLPLIRKHVTKHL